MVMWVLCILISHVMQQETGTTEVYMRIELKKSIEKIEETNSPGFFNMFPASHHHYSSSWTDLLAILVLVLLLTQSLLHF